MTEIPLRVRMVKGRPVPLVPEACEPHTPQPDGYLARIEWADRMADTHDQRPCSGCGLWAVWVPRSLPGIPATAVLPVPITQTGDAA